MVLIDFKGYFHNIESPAEPGSIPGAGDKNKRLISLPCNIRRCAPPGGGGGYSHK